MIKNINQDNCKTTYYLYSSICRDYICGKKQSEYRIKYNIPVVWSKLYKRENIVNNQIEFQEVYFSNDVLFSAKSAFFARSISVDTRPVYCHFKGVPKQLTSYSTAEERYIRAEVECCKILFLKQHRVKWNTVFPALCIYKTIKEKNGLSHLKEYIKLFCEYHIPIIGFCLLKDFVSFSLVKELIYRKSAKNAQQKAERKQ